MSSMLAGSTKAIDLMEIFEIKDPCNKNTGEKFLKAYADSACTTVYPMNIDNNVFQLDLGA